MKKLSLLLILLAMSVMCGCSSDTAPTPADFSVRAEEDGIVLTWSKTKHASGYRLYRKQTAESDFKFLADTEKNEFTDTGAEVNMQYIYRVTAINKNGESEPAESEVIARNNASVSSKELSAPKITSVTRMDKYTNVVIFEDKNSDCSYEVQRADSANGSFITLGITDEKVFYDDQAAGNNCYYRVCAVTDGAASEYCEAAAAGTNAGTVFGVPIFMYHEFVTNEDLQSGVAFDEYAIYKNEFESDLLWLQSNGYTTITTKMLTDYLEGSGELPAKPVIITIDDGKLGVYKNAYPLLQKYGMKASLALIGERIDEASKYPDQRATDPAPYCTWDEIGKMAHSGCVEMISHTYNLHIYNHDNRHGADCAEGEAIDDFVLSAKKDYTTMQKQLQKITGSQTVTLSYPYSKRSTTADKAWLMCGYKLLVAGNDSDARKTYINYFVREAGINSKSALTRRIVRMNGTSIGTYMNSAINEDQ